MSVTHVCGNRFARLEHALSSVGYEPERLLFCIGQGPESHFPSRLCDSRLVQGSKVCCWSFVLESGVRPFVVVAVSIDNHGLLRMSDRLEDIGVEEFVSNFAVGAFKQSVITGFAATTQTQRDTAGLEPVSGRSANGFWTIVTLNLVQSAVLCEEITEYDVCRLPGKGPLHMQCEQLSGELVDDDQHAKTQAIRRHVIHKVHRIALSQGRRAVTVHLAPPCADRSAGRRCSRHPEVQDVVEEVEGAVACVV